MKKFILGIIVGGIIFGTSVYAVTNYLYEANEVSYTPSDTTWNVSDVKDALNDLHDKAKNYIPAPSGNKQITISSTGTSSAVDVTNYATATCKTSGLYSSCSSCCSCPTAKAVYLGEYSSDTTIDVSGLGATSANQFITFCGSDSVTSYQVHNNGLSEWQQAVATLTEASVSLSGNKLSLSVCTLNAKGAMYQYSANKTKLIPTKVYYVGNITTK